MATVAAAKAIPSPTFRLMGRSNGAVNAPVISPCRVAVVGCGLIGRQRVEALLTIPGAELAGTVDPAADRPPASLAPHYESLDEVPADTYDAAVVAVPHDLAFELAETVLRAGKPVLIEKPLGISSAQARELERLASALPLPSFVGYNYRFLPAIRELVGLVRSGQLGTLRNLDLLLGHGGDPGSTQGWKLDPARAGGGALLDPGVHLLDLLLVIAPDAVCTSVEATRGFWGTETEEDVVATFRAENLIGTVRASRIRWLNTFRVEVHGEDGYAIAEGRGGNYGPMTMRLGRRWAWRDQGVVSQRDSEEVRDFGQQDASLSDELTAILSAWTGAGPQVGFPAPAQMAEARAITELFEQLSPRIGDPPA